MKVSQYNIFVENPKKNNWLVYNTLSNCLIEMSPDIKAYLDQMTQDNFRKNIDKSTIEDLLEMGFIVDDNINELNIALQRDQEVYKNLSSGKNISLTISPTYDCNFNCPYCFVHTNKELYNTSGMTLETQDKIVQLYEQHCNSQKENYTLNNQPEDRVVWYGGEPLLEVKTIDKIQSRINEIAGIYNRKVKRMIVTNGSLLEKENALILKRNKIKLIQVTIDGIEEIHNKNRMFREKPVESFNKILDNIANLDDYFILTIRINVNKENTKYLDDFLQILENNSIWPFKKNVKLKLSPILDSNNEGLEGILTVNDFEEINRQFRISQLKRYNKIHQKPAKLRLEFPSRNNYYRCMEAFNPNAWVIGAKGDLYTCWENMADESCKVGYIDELIEKGRVKEPLKFKIDKNYRQTFNCKECKYLPICHLGCFAGYWKTGKKDERVCSAWKSKLVETILNNYELQENSPEIIEFQQ